MPKLHPRDIQVQLERDQVWPVYWLYGPERMKTREVVKRIRNHLFGEQPAGLNEERMSGSEVSAAQITENAGSLSLLGETRLILVDDAHQIKKPEELERLLGPSDSKDKMTSVVVFLSKDLDGRKKFSKRLTKNAAVVPCEDVPDQDRGAWVNFLAQQKKIELDEGTLAMLRSMDPWSLDLVDRELEKFQEAVDAGVSQPADVLIGGGGTYSPEEFLSFFFSRNKRRSLAALDSFAERPEASIPLLGLMAWNVRTLSLYLADREAGTRSLKLNPYLSSKLDRWQAQWKASELTQLQNALMQVDFQLKQTSRRSIGIWGELVQRFCVS